MPLQSRESLFDIMCRGWVTTWKFTTQRTASWSSTGPQSQTKREQQHIFDTLAAEKCSFRPVDIAAPENATHKKFLRENSPKGLQLPQLWVEGQFRADYKAFEEAVENSTINDLLRPLQEPEFPLH